MAISTRLRQNLYRRAGGRCECAMKTCDHHPGGIRCNSPLVLGVWWIHRKVGRGPDRPENLLAICEKCYLNARDQRNK